MKQRIWELDALRGLCILGMIVVHFVYDLVTFAGISLNVPRWFSYMQEYGHLFFVLISGICATFGSKCVKRGIQVLCAALLVSYVTLFMDYVLHMSGVRIWFGILHLLGSCMLLYSLFRKLPFWALAALGIALAALGYWMQTLTVPVDYLFPLGLRSGNIFTGSDFFPLLPGFGWFLVGASLGKSLYKERKSLLPRWNADFFLLHFLRLCGKHSLVIYLLHQPILFCLTLLLA